MRPVAAWTLAGSAVAFGCGSGGWRDGGDAGLDATTSKDGVAEVSFFGDAVAMDAPIEDVASIELEAGGPFLCAGCICNGADHFCVLQAVGDRGLPLSPIDAGPPECDAGQVSCVPIPSQCLPSPSCSCVTSNVPLVGTCQCQLDPTGNGILIGCLLP